MVSSLLSIFSVATKNNLCVNLENYAAMFSRGAGCTLKWALLLSSLGEASIPKRQIPAQPQGLQTISSPSGIHIRYKNPDICETTPGVKTYSGYVDLDPTTHIFFWFLEARENPAEAPITLWLTGGPGSDSLLAAFIGIALINYFLPKSILTGRLLENGPCKVTDGMGPVYNPYSWSNHSNMIYLSQPVGTGFSYSEEAPGSLDPNTGLYVPPSVAPVTGGSYNEHDIKYI